MSAMQPNPILTEIRATRDEHARECGYDIHKIFDELRAETARLQAEGRKVVYPAADESSILREEPLKS